MIQVHAAKVVSNTQLIRDVYSVAVQCPDLARDAVPGQFGHIKCGSTRLLRRPVSFCDVRGDTVRFVFEVKGDGTKWLSQRTEGDTLDILGPLGRGFTLQQGLYRKIIVTGGGLGVPPMFYLAQKALAQTPKIEVVVILGFRDKDKIIMEDEFRAISKDVIITTEDGSMGISGRVSKPLDQVLRRGMFDGVYSCGPFNMQKSVAAMCESYLVPCQVSMEERMGCGVGACLVCACRTAKDGNERMSRVCADGPVFNAEDIVWANPVSPGER